MKFLFKYQIVIYLVVSLILIFLLIWFIAANLTFLIKKVNSMYLAETKIEPVHSAIDFVVLEDLKLFLASKLEKIEVSPAANP